MGYSTISFYPVSQDTIRTVTEFVKFRHNNLPVEMCILGDIFKTKVDKVLCDIEGVKTYIENILVLSKDRFSKQIKTLSIIFGRLCTV